MKTSVISACAALLCTAASWAGTIVEVEGRAPADEPMARAQALADALREAVREGAGVDLVSETEVKNFTMEYDRMFSKARGHVKKYEVLSTSTAPDGFYVVRIRADVGEGTVDTGDKLSLRMMAQLYQSPRVSVRIDERIEGVTNGSLASDWLRNSAAECGLRIVETDRAQGDGGMMTKRAQSLGRAQEATMRGEGIVSDCDYVIVGSVVGSSAGSKSFYGSKPAKKFSLGVNLKVIDAATGMVILAENAPSRDILIRNVESDTAAAREAVRQLMEGSPRVTGSDAGWKLIRRIFAHWAAEMDLGAVCKMEFIGMDLATANLLKEKLASIQNVGSVWIRSIDPSGVSVVDCEARLQSPELAAIVEQALPGFRLDRSENRYLSFRPRPAAPRPNSAAAAPGSNSSTLLYGLGGGGVLAALAVILLIKQRKRTI